MKTRRMHGSNERRVLTSMIVDTSVLSRIAAKWRKGLFRTRWANLIGSWCVKYFKRYQKAPMHHIESIYESWAEQAADKETIKLVERFLASLSAEYQKLRKNSNTDYILDLAGKLFNEVRIEQLTESLQGDIDLGNVNKANQRITGFNRVDLGINEGIDVLQDQDAIKKAFADKQEPLIKYPGALGRFFNDQLERDGFIAFMGSDKRGKSFWLMDVAWRGMVQRRKVAIFEVGDMSENQIMRRFMVRASRRPLKAQRIHYPIEIEREEDSLIASVRFKRKRFEKGLMPKIAIKACNEVMEREVGSKKSLLKLFAHPNSSLTVGGLTNIIEEWDRNNWLPDIIVIDYADILNMSYSGIEGRDRINETWKQLRKLSQQLHCLVVTATQSDTPSYGKRTLGPANFSDDKRKLAHVTGMVGINSTAEEIDRGIRRLNWVVLREGKYNVNRCVHVAGCLALANPAIKSCF